MAMVSACINLIAIFILQGASFANADQDLALKATLVTAQNRNYPSMMGGWGPHLRGLMRNSKNELWIAVDRGPSVQNNTHIDYYRNIDGKWTLAGTLAQLTGVQQNLAHVMTNERFILSYGVSKTYKGIQECYFDTLNMSYKACNIVYVAGKPLVIDPNTDNYVSASVAPDSATRIVSWASMGPNGNGGKFNYIFNDGWTSREKTGQWRGVFSDTMMGYTNFGYLYGQLLDADRFVGAGQLFVGVYPNGTYQSTALDFKLGSKKNMQLLWSSSSDYASGLRLDTIEDSYAHGSSQHILARSFKGSIAYVYRSASGQKPVTQYFPGVYRGRLHVNSKYISMITASSAKNEIYVRRAPIALIDSDINWQNIPVSKLTVGDASFGGITGIYIEGAQTQSRKVQGLNFAVTGGGNQTGFPNGGHQIWHLQSEN